eukprot:scaffold1883_cov261-Pinguiococcus_pyrenoidosus.AAC.12
MLLPRHRGMISPTAASQAYNLYCTEDDILDASGETLRAKLDDEISLGSLDDDRENAKDGDAPDDFRKLDDAISLGSSDDDQEWNSRNAVTAGKDPPQRQEDSDAAPDAGTKPRGKKRMRRRKKRKSKKASKDHGNTSSEDDMSDIVDEFKDDMADEVKNDMADEVNAVNAVNAGELNNAEEDQGTQVSPQATESAEEAGSSAVGQSAAEDALPDATQDDVAGEAEIEAEIDMGTQREDSDNDGHTQDWDARGNVRPASSRTILRHSQKADEDSDGMSDVGDDAKPDGKRRRVLDSDDDDSD